MVNPDIFSFLCLLDNVVMIIERVIILQDPEQYYVIYISGCTVNIVDANIFYAKAKK